MVLHQFFIKYSVFPKLHKNILNRMKNSQKVKANIDKYTVAMLLPITRFLAHECDKKNCFWSLKKYM